MATYKGHPVISDSGASEQVEGFEARYPSVCARCRRAIAVGDWITRGDAGGYRHVTCPNVKSSVGLQDASGSAKIHDATNHTHPPVPAPGGAAQSSTEPLEIPRGLPNGVWTIEGPKGHRTYRISTIQPVRGLAKLASPAERRHVEGPQSDVADAFRAKHAGKRVLELLVGPDNTASYRGMAWIDAGNDATSAPRSCIGNLWKFGRDNEVLVNVFAKLVEREEKLADYKVHFARHCYKCNRLLTTPESIQRGIGPICANGGWD
jgi:Family of unknown function (DUF6011)